MADLAKMHVSYLNSMLEAGRIAEQGTHNDLLVAQGVYSRLYNAQKQLEDLGEVSA